MLLFFIRIDLRNYSHFKHQDKNIDIFNISRKYNVFYFEILFHSSNLVIQLSNPDRK